MGLLSSINLGTKNYPERVARRLRVMNIAAWVAAALSAFFALRGFAAPPGYRLIEVTANGIAALCFAALPLLHRFGPLAAPLAFVGFAYAFIFWVVLSTGTGGGAWVGYLTAVPLVVIIFGPQHLLLNASLAALAAALIVILHLIAPANTGMLPDDTLFYGNFVTNVVVGMALLFTVVNYASRQIARAENDAEREYARSENLLLELLPRSIAERLKNNEPVVADKYETASVLFADMAGFTARASDMAPEELVRFLNRVFTEFDALVDKHGLEKIKTTGDAYMVVSGVPKPRPDHAEALADFALDMRDIGAALRDPQGRPVRIRIGMASGPVVAGVIGTTKLFYDVWGDAVNVASRMEETDEAGMIQVSQGSYELLAGKFVLEQRGPVDIKGKGRMVTWRLMGRAARTGAA
ncbi:MAG TPA: adenylate/guanylate cyclase domain-containing protein [Rhizobiaceae bacterium]|nr:adenylate/guanylate cyclase domain-containing protein [Rhizobiaceae bacterium]